MRLVIFGLFALLATAAPLANESPARGKAVEQIPPGKIDGATARRLVAEGVKVVDVRTPEEYASGHVPGAINVPYDQVEKRSAELGPPSTPLVLYCRSGARSGKAVQTLAEKGFTRLYDLQSYDAWVRSEPKTK
jgi:phage shock protein E